MNDFSLHIIIYSELKPYGGGRETWLQYFLPAIISQFKNVFIYAIRKPGELEQSIVDGLSESVEALYTLEVDRKKFIADVKNGISDRIEEKDVCILIGSIVEGEIAPWIKKYYPKVICMIWVRSIAAYEVANRHNKLLYPLISMIEKRNLNAADTVITNGLDTYEYYKKYINHRNMVAIPNAVNYKEYICERNWNSNIVKFLFLGRFERIKGARIMLDAIKTFNYKYPQLINSVTFDIWGSGSMSDEELPFNVIYHNRAERSQIPEILANSDFQFFLSDPNDKAPGGLSHSLLESISSGCIPIASAIPAYLQILNDDNSILVWEQTADYVSEIIRKICIEIQVSPQKYKAMSEVLFTLSKQYSIEKHITKFMKIISAEEEKR